MYIVCWFGLVWFGLVCRNCEILKEMVGRAGLLGYASPFGSSQATLKTLTCFVEPERRFLPTRQANFVCIWII